MGRTGSKAPAVARRLLVYIVLVSSGTFALVVLAALTLLTSSLTTATWLGLAALLLASCFVEAFPVPIKGVRAGGFSLAAVFIVATGCLYGWAAAAVL